MQRERDQNVCRYPRRIDRKYRRKIMSTYRELLEQKSALDQQIAIARKAEAKQALDAVHTLIADFGFTAQQVFPWKPAAKNVEAKSRAPKAGASWTGRGRAPKWIEGKDRADFLV